MIFSLVKRLTSKSIILWVLKFSNVNPRNSKTALTLPFIQSKVLQPYHESLSKKQFLWRKKKYKTLWTTCCTVVWDGKKGVIKSDCKLMSQKKEPRRKKNPLISLLHWTIELSSIKLSLQFKVCVKLQIRLYQSFFSVLHNEAIIYMKWDFHFYTFLYIFPIIKTRSFWLLLRDSKLKNLVFLIVERTTVRDFTVLKTLKPKISCEIMVIEK